MVNVRLRKAFKNNIKIYSIGNPGDLTYDYEIIGENTEDVKDIFENRSKFSEKILSSKKPLIIIGESALELKSGKFIFEKIKEFLWNNNFISEKWNGLNILPQNASTVGAIDLGLVQSEKQNNFLFLTTLKIINLKFYIYLVQII